MQENKKLNGIEADALEAAFNKSVSNTPTRFPESQVGQSPEPLKEKVRTAQMLAGEQAVVDNLRAKGFYETRISQLQNQIKTIAIDERIAELKKDFSGSPDYISGVNDGMYHLFRDLLPQLEAARQSPEGQDELERLRELVSWLKQECIPGTMTADLSHDFAESLLNRLDNL